MQVFQNHFHQIVNGSTNRCSGAWRQRPNSLEHHNRQKDSGNCPEAALAYRGEGGLGEFLGHQFKKVTEHWPWNFCNPCNPLPASHVPSPVLSPNVTSTVILKGKPQPRLYHLPIPSWVKFFSGLPLPPGQNRSLLIQPRPFQELALISLPHPVHQTSCRPCVH